MKKYFTPEMNIDSIILRDVITVSLVNADAAKDNDITVSLEDGFWG